MRLLLVNANTNAEVTARLQALAQSFASPGTEIVSVTARFGATAVATRAEALIAEAAAVDAVARHDGLYDGVLVAMSYDTAVVALRDMTGRPVVGLMGALLSAATVAGDRTGLICLGRALIPRYGEILRRAGLDGRVAGWGAVEGMAVYSGGPAPSVEADLATEALRLVERSGADTVGLVGAGMAGIAARIGRVRQVPVLDPLGAAVAQVEMLVRLWGGGAREFPSFRPEPTA